MKITLKAETRNQFECIPGVTFITMERTKGNSFYSDEYSTVMSGAFNIDIPQELIGFDTDIPFINAIRYHKFPLQAFSIDTLKELHVVLKKMYDELKKY